MGTAEHADDGDGKAVVVLVDCAGGRELEVVHDTLTHSLHTPTVLITHADLAAVAMSLDLTTGLLDVDGRRVRPAVVWVRHSSAGAMMAQARPAGVVTPLEATSWSHLLAQLSASTTAALPGSAPAGPGQLVDAGRLGVKTPHTVLTTDVNAGVRHMGTPTVIVKNPDFRIFEPDPQNWSACLPAVVDRDSVPADRVAGGRPVVVQEYVPHARELRVYFLDGGICAFEVGKSEPSSLWTDPTSVTVTRAGCPEDAETAVRTLCAAWNLRFAAFDLLVSDAGELVFLEANPDGDWLWFERKARWHGVSFMAAVMVRELFVRGTSLGVREDDCNPR
jgi:hypothetical protein